MLVLDLKSHSEICQTSRKLFQGRSTYIFSNACVYSTHGIHAVENLSALCGTVPWQLRRQAFHLLGPVPYYGFRPTDVSRKIAGLAYLRRFRPSSDRRCQKALPEGILGRGTEKHGLRLGCYDDRPLSVYLPLGALPENKGSCPASHPAGSAGQYPELYPYHPEKSTKSTCWIFSLWKQAPFTSWIAATWTSPDSMLLLGHRRSSLSGPNRI